MHLAPQAFQQYNARFLARGRAGNLVGGPGVCQTCRH
nr:hypothetical protein [Serratia odorifera]